MGIKTTHMCEYFIGIHQVKLFTFKLDFNRFDREMVLKLFELSHFTHSYQQKSENLKLCSSILSLEVFSVRKVKFLIYNLISIVNHTTK